MEGHRCILVGETVHLCREGQSHIEAEEEGERGVSSGGDSVFCDLIHAMTADCVLDADQIRSDQMW